MAVEERKRDVRHAPTVSRLFLMSPENSDLMAPSMSFFDSFSYSANTARRCGKLR